MILWLKTGDESKQTQTSTFADLAQCFPTLFDLLHKQAQPDVGSLPPSLINHEQQYFSQKYQLMLVLTPLNRN